PRLVVRVPDGEIEDLGTVFSVTVEDGQTREIIVREGRVLFRRHGAPTLQLVAGTSWRDTGKPPEIEVPPPPEPKLEPPLVPPAPAPVAKLKKARRASVPAVEPPAEEAHGEGDAGSAEDAAYLHILALLREGRRDEARLAAFSYLSAFPNGFRAIEVARIAGAPARDGKPGTN
ncbi:MAG TPA: hypothetical protein VI299_21875, partial [Polyangiales bacterium]